MSYIVKLSYFVLFVSLSQSSVLPVEKCDLNDSKCLASEFQKAVPVFMPGIPDLGIDPMDVMEMDEIKFELAGLQFGLKEGRLKGLKGSVIDRVNWDLSKKRIEIDYHANTVLKGHYTASGRLLILPISGDGQLKIKLRHISVQLYIDYDIVKNEDGKDHIKPTKYDFDFQVKENAHFNLTNLFNGNKELSDTMLNFMNENWSQVANEFGRPLLEATAEKIFKNVKIYFDKYPIKDIAIV